MMAAASALLFVAAAIGHFLQADAARGLVLEWIPMSSLFSEATGVLELALAGGFLFRSTRVYAGWIAIAFLVAIFAANVSEAPNAVYVMVSAPLQLFLVLWIHLSCIHPGSPPSHALNAV